MHKQLILILVCAIGFAAPASASASVTKSCQSVKNVVPTGMAVPAIRIRATGVTCKLARSIPRRITLFVRYGSMNPTQFGLAALGLGQWRCRIPYANHAKNICYTPWSPGPFSPAPGSKRVSWYVDTIAN